MFYNYNSTDGNIYTCGCAKKDSYFRAILQTYDLIVPSYDFNEILSIHKAVRLDQDEYNAFSLYERYGMYSSQYYFERQIDQFYRISFFFRELIAHGILYGEVVIDENFVNAIPREILAILENDAYYSRYLSNLRERLLENINDWNNAKS